MTPAAAQRPGTTRTLLVEKGSGGAIASRVRRTVLPGGLRVVTETMPGVRSASIGVWVGVGSRDESPQRSGASHFLEHLLFKGTPTRSALDLSVALDRVGGECNAFTAKEYTCFHARVLDDDLALAVDVLGDMVTSSLLAAEDVEAEREVILDEIAMHDDDPDDVVQNLFAAQAWGSSPLGRPVAGTTESVAALTQSKIAGYYASRYTPSNIVVAVAGNLDHGAVVRVVRKAFSRGDFLADSAAVPHEPRRSRRAQRVAAGSATLERPFEQVNLVLGVNALVRTDDRRYALGVLNAALGAGTSSRLFQEIRERRGLAYSVYSYAVHYADAGAFAVAVGCLPAKAREVVDVVRRELSRLAETGITEDELARGKGQLRGGLVLGLEDSGARMSRIAKAELVYDEMPAIDEVIRRIDEVSVEDVHALAGTLLSGPDTLAAVGPAHAVRHLDA
ncbi:MAG TPA: pitrilysin family protein [Nocardioidaceae bacterium]|nr:pitrilysin family protein [Nocardioidaceae bacterium]